MINVTVKILKGNSINSLLGRLNMFIRTRFIVIETIRINAFTKLFIKAPMSLFFLAK